MKSYIKATLLLLLACYGCGKSGNPANDLTVFGLKGRVQFTKTIGYDSIYENNGRWEVKAGARPSYEVETYFNRQGNISKIVFLPGLEIIKETVYEYSGNIKKSWKTMGDDGKLQEKGTVDVKGNTITETTYDLEGNRSFETITTLDDEHRTYKTEVRLYDVKENKLNYQTVSTTLAKDDKGFVTREVVEDKLNGNTWKTENVILERDKENNPLRLLLKKDGKPEKIMITQIAYYE